MTFQDALRRRFGALVLVAVFAVSALAPSAYAQGGSGPLLEPPPPEVETAAPPPEDPDNGFGSLEQLLMLGAAIGLISGIAFVITRDARRNAPPDPRPQQSDADAGGPAQAKHRARDRDKKRAKAKQARKQRKRNR